MLCCCRPGYADDGALLDGGSSSSSALADPIPCTVLNDVAWSKDLKKLRLLSNKGGSCNVYAAELHGENVAVKIPRVAADERATSDLLKERLLLEELGAKKPHRHIIRLIGHGTHPEDGRPFIVLERLQSTLFDVLPKPVASLNEVPEFEDEVTWCEWRLAAARFPLRRAVALAHQLALALEHLHHHEPIAGHRVLHRDLKPDNCGFLAETGTLVLFDFGLATRWRCTSDAAVSADDPRPLTGQTGSARYMSPEVATSSPYNEKAEVFSFAIILWQLAAHERPFRRMSAAQHSQRVCRDGERPKLKRSWPSELRTLLTDMWQHEPRARPSMTEVVRRLEALMKGLQQPKSSKHRAQIAAQADQNGMVVQVEVT